MMNSCLMVIYTIGNNSICQYNKFTPNPHFSAVSKYMSGLYEVSKQYGSFSVLQLNVQGICALFD